jgi:hypothetical protein
MRLPRQRRAAYPAARPVRLQVVLASRIEAGRAAGGECIASWTTQVMFAQQERAGLCRRFMAAPASGSI